MAESACAARAGAVSAGGEAKSWAGTRTAVAWTTYAAACSHARLSPSVCARVHVVHTHACHRAPCHACLLIFQQMKREGARDLAAAAVERGNSSTDEEDRDNGQVLHHPHGKLTEW
jgi:hypothetical protein